MKQEADGKACYAVGCVKDGVAKTLKFTETGTIVIGNEKKGKSGSVASCC
ncbi:hypothetical protein KsCSTR_12000 [Candidatus Kuenenia stuttgartiensis]|uniref:Uncharacterized protein n=1 Tax=Kuenenia stuttgartiensis TaxID=174633 RepID=A0A6G7GMP3_KUEST|nr:hypothetical protein [Candidatus Kuenenia stuttgartiensis]MBE7547633.1 hypothetical protein [Planctomycetia bacterium]QII10579.1 hypothetical protein KsCSTR_12000 [Candidatus Kuenenia stuttgartiensis]GJQ47740.1 MAG: hypothetical protein HKUEN01_01260 [Candidatus Kuenenia stuttgartiensis]